MPLSEKDINKLTSQQKIISNIPLEGQAPSGISHIGKERAYQLLHEQALRHRPLPKEAQSFCGSVAWPISPFDEDVLITCPFNAYNYVTPNEPFLHRAVDIQSEVGKEVSAPADIQVINVEVDPRSLGQNDEVVPRTLVDVTYVVSSKQVGKYVLIGTISHLDSASLTKDLQPMIGVFDASSKVFMKKGTLLGAVGSFPFWLMGKRHTMPGIAKKFGRRYDHIDIRYQLFPRNLFNPDLKPWDVWASNVPGVNKIIIDPFLISQAPGEKLR